MHFLTDFSHISILLAGKVWIRQMMLSALLLPTLVCGTAFFINFIAIYYHASRAIAFTIMVSLNEVELLLGVVSGWLIHTYFMGLDDVKNMKGSLIQRSIIISSFPSAGSDLHLHLCHSASDIGGDSAGAQPGRTSQLSMSC